MGHEQAANEKENHGHQRRPLQTAEAHDGVARGATTGITRTKANHEAPEHQDDPGAQTAKGLPTEKRFGQQAVLRAHAQSFYRGLCFGGKGHSIGIGQQAATQQSTEEDAASEKQIPAFSLPVIFQKRNVFGVNRCAGVAQTRRNTQHFIARDEQKRHGNAYERAAHIPRPGLREPFNESTHVLVAEFKGENGFLHVVHQVGRNAAVDEFVQAGALHTANGNEVDVVVGRKAHHAFF